MNFNMPMAVFGGLALIAAAIYFGPGSQNATTAGGVQKVVLCNESGKECAPTQDRTGRTIGGYTQKVIICHSKDHKHC